MHIINTIVAQAALATAAVDPVTTCLRAAGVSVAPSLPTPYTLRLPYKPLIVAVPTSTSQIASAVSCAARHGIRVNARSGGHSYTASSLGGEDGHLVINLDRMYAVSVTSDGIARVQAGARIGHVATELYRQGKRGISHGTCPGVGIGGHAIHGGHGMVSPKYGLATDWIKAASVVFANGTVTRCSAQERPNLFWAVRGAGSSMAIVAEFEFNTFMAPEQLTAFDISLEWDARTAPGVLLGVQEFALDMPAEMTMAVKFNKKGYYINGVYAGNGESLRQAIQPLLTKLGVGISTAKTMSWMNFNKYYAGTDDIDITTATYDEHENFYASSITTPPLSLSNFKNLVETVERTGFSASSSWFIHMNLHGGRLSAITRPKVDDTAYAHRDKMLLFQFKDVVSPPQQYSRNGFKLLKGFRQSISLGLAIDSWGMYVNYPDSELDGQDAPSLYWKTNLARLQWIKRDYDPKNIFQDTQSVQPA